MAEVEVVLPDTNYRIIIEAGALKKIGRLIRETVPADACAVIADSKVLPLYGAEVKRACEEAGYRSIVAAFPYGEANKTLDSVNMLYEALLDARLERSSPVIACGGGVTGDTAGFVAATYLRGVPLIQCPTSLLAMVDSSVGGKTGVNVPQGKNLIGSFYQPRLVVADPLVLSTLPAREFACGLAECIKHGLLGDASLFEWIEQESAALLAKEPAKLVELIARNVQLKADIVSADEKEAGIRAYLNLGHTFGHALERTSNYGIPHGEAVGLGMIAATAFSVGRNWVSLELLERLKKLLAAVGLPQTCLLPAGEELLKAMRLDKKVQSEKIRLVIPERAGAVRVVDDASDKEILSAFLSISSKQ